MKRSTLAKLDRRAARFGLYILRTDREWKVYCSVTGKILASIYPATWRTLLHVGSQEGYGAENAFDALRIVNEIWSNT